MAKIFHGIEINFVKGKKKMDSQIEFDGIEESTGPYSNDEKRLREYRMMTDQKCWPNLIMLVKDFQEKVLRIPFPGKPRIMDDRWYEETYEKFLEESEEFLEASTLDDTADAIADLIYFALGAAHQAGIPLETVFYRVHEANIRKEFGKTKRGHETDAAKPDDWQAPDHSWLDDEAEVPSNDG
jgi:phosphoribosyl-ATP pyrophosphohydrolase